MRRLLVGAALLLVLVAAKPAPAPATLTVVTTPPMLGQPIEFAWTGTFRTHDRPVILMSCVQEPTETQPTYWSWSALQDPTLGDPPVILGSFGWVPGVPADCQATLTSAGHTGDHILTAPIFFTAVPLG